MIKHGWSNLFDVDILDAEGPDLEFPIPNGKRIQKNLVGKNIKIMIPCSFFPTSRATRWAASAARSNSSPSDARPAQARRTSTARASPEAMWTTEQNAFLESMADAAESVVKLFDGKIVYINVMKNMSVDCDCCAVAEDRV